MPKLSVIIPCYNCESTLQAAVESVYRQEPVVPFDLTLVDDGSRDGTYQLMEQLAGRHANVRLIRHATNLGGGAARNTAVANCDGELIFCLDSDDMLGPDFLRKMTGLWIEKRCDGIGISTSIKFRKNDVRDVAHITEFEGPGKEVRFESLFDSSACSLFSTFLITRGAFEFIGGYPTSHGFDTQGMAFRFLGNGLKAYTCPGTVYLHRVGYHQSYYLREAGAGKTHWNWFKILQEFLYLFRDDVKVKILEHELFPPVPCQGLEVELGQLRSEQTIYADAFQRYLRLGRHRAAEELAHSTNMYDQYWVGTYHLSHGAAAKALDHFVRALRLGFTHRIILPEVLEAAAGTAGSGTVAGVSIDNWVYYVNDPQRRVEPTVPLLSRYQTIENKLIWNRHWRVLGEGLKRGRLLLRRFRQHKRT